MNIFFNGFWDNFVGSTECDVFISLFEKIFNNNNIIINDINNSDILVECLFTTSSCLHDKEWKYSFLFIGEPCWKLATSILHNRSIDFLNDYSCILKGETNNKNIINFPLFVLYKHRFNLYNKWNNHEYISKIPEKNVCVIISNGEANERNYFYSELEKVVHIDYGGRYKNNIPRVEYEYFSNEFIQFISNYKFIITMENSKEERYITEKILHGFCANTIPVYWGSDYVHQYFNEKRFINVKSMDHDSVNSAINKIVNLINNSEQYLEMVNEPVYTNEQIDITIDTIASDVKNLLHL
jgi:hypothetical protein